MVIRILPARPFLETSRPTDSPETLKMSWRNLTEQEIAFYDSHAEPQHRSGVNVFEDDRRFHRLKV